MATHELLSSTRLPAPVHGVAFNPRDAGELACVGQGAVTLWLLQQRGTSLRLQVRREPIPEEVGAGELTSLCFGATPLLYCGSNTGRVCVWDASAGRCFLAWDADDGEIGVLLCSGARLLSGSNTRRLRLWAVGAVPELRCKGSRARSSSVLMERELTLDGAVVSAVFHDSMDMGVVGTTAGTLWYISWAEGTSLRAGLQDPGRVVSLIQGCPRAGTSLLPNLGIFAVVWGQSPGSWDGGQESTQLHKE